MKGTAAQARTYRRRARRPVVHRLGGMSWAEFKRAVERSHAEFFKLRNIDTDTLPVEICTGFMRGKR